MDFEIDPSTMEVRVEVVPGADVRRSPHFSGACKSFLELPLVVLLAVSCSFVEFRHLALQAEFSFLLGLWLVFRFFTALLPTRPHLQLSEPPWAGGAARVRAARCLECSAYHNGV